MLPRVVLFGETSTWRQRLEAIYAGHVKTVWVTDPVVALNTARRLKAVIVCPETNWKRVAKRVPVLVVGSSNSIHLRAAFVEDDADAILRRTNQLLRRWDKTRAIADAYTKRHDQPLMLAEEDEPTARVGISLLADPYDGNIYRTLHDFRRKTIRWRTRSCSTLFDGSCLPTVRPEKQSPRTIVGLSRRVSTVVLRAVSEYVGGGIQHDKALLRTVRDVAFAIGNARSLKRGLRQMLTPKLGFVDFVETVPFSSTDRGVAYYKAGNYEAALRIFDARRTADYKTLFWRGLAQARLGFAVQAVLDFDTVLHALKLHSCYSDRSQLKMATIFNRALVRANLGDDEHAVEDLETLRQLDPANHKYAETMSIFYRRLGDWDQAVRHSNRPHPPPADSVPPLDPSVRDLIFDKPSDIQLALSIPAEKRTPVAAEFIAKHLDTLSAFRGLPNLELLAVEYRCLDADTLIFAKSQLPLASGVVLSGLVGARLSGEKGVVMSEFRQGDVFGEDAEVTSSPYNATYYALEPTEMLLVVGSDQSTPARAFRERMLARLQQRCHMLRESPAFQSWSNEAIVELGRLAVLQVHSKDSLILHQAVPPQALMLVCKGVCRVERYTDRAGTIKARIAHLSAERDTLRRDYCFHHTLQDKAGRIPHNLDAASPTKTDQGSMPSRSTAVSTLPFTITEYRLEQLQDEIRHLNECLAPPAHSRRKSSIFREIHHAPHAIGVLMPPRICGESAILHPERPSPHSVRADTHVHILVMHKLLFRRRNLPPQFLTDLERHARVTMPHDRKLLGKPSI